MAWSHQVRCFQSRRLAPALATSGTKRTSRRLRPKSAIGKYAARSSPLLTFVRSEIAARPRPGKNPGSGDGRESERADREAGREICPECSRNESNVLGGDCKDVFTQKKHLCRHAGNEALEAEDIEHAGEVVAERHQAPFATYLVEATNEEVPIAGTAFERSKGMLDNGGTTAHQFVRVCALHPCAMTFEHVLVLPAADGSSGCLR